MNISKPPIFDLAIIGGGFSGTLALVHALKHPGPSLHIALFSRSNVARGVAYSTRDDHHLLNVPAHNMSAFPDVPDHFVTWLASRKETQHYTPSDFVPRRIYGDYLESIFAAALKDTQHHVTLIEEEVSRIAHDHTITSDTQTITATRIVLALGNEAAQTPGTGSTISPWELLTHPLPNDDAQIVILGAGLTGVDSFLTLRARGFKGKIYLVSRSGRIPQPHLRDPQKYPWAADFPASLSGWLHTLRNAVATHPRWQEVVDSLRPHLQTLWRAQSVAARTRFLNKYFGLWNIHRHRMAPQIWEALHADTHLEILATRKKAVPSAALTIHCIGQEYRTTTLRNPLVQQLLRDGLLQPHATGFGVTANGHCVGQGIYAVGPLLIGELLETTAVPELRHQAQQVVVEALQT